MSGCLWLASPPAWAAAHEPASDGQHTISDLADVFWFSGAVCRELDREEAQ